MSSNVGTCNTWPPHPHLHWDRRTAAHEFARFDRLGWESRGTGVSRATKTETKRNDIRRKVKRDRGVSSTRRKEELREAEQVDLICEVEYLVQVTFRQMFCHTCKHILRADPVFQGNLLVCVVAVRIESNGTVTHSNISVFVGQIREMIPRSNDQTQNHKFQLRM